MRFGAKLVSTGLFLGAAIVGGLAAVNAQGPTVQELTSDISTIESTIAEARAFADRYSEGSFIRVQSDLRIAILETTKAMLDQKRSSWLRGIKLSYLASGQTIAAATPESVASIEGEIARAKVDAQTAKSKAQMYTGGLIQSLALVEEQTHLVAAAAAQQRLALIRLGMAVPSTGKAAPSLNPIGKDLNDRGAL
jgi:hypothetical protein